MLLKKLNILFVLNDPKYYFPLVSAAEKKGHQADIALSVDHAVELVEERGYDLIVSEYKTKKINGIELVHKIRQKGFFYVKIFLCGTERNLKDELLTVLKYGANDLLHSPVTMHEIEVKVLSQLGLYARNKASFQVVGDIRIDYLHGTLNVGGRKVSIKPTGMKILSILAESYPMPVYRKELSNIIWMEKESTSNILRAHLYELRKSINSASTEVSVKNIGKERLVLKASA